VRLLPAIVCLLVCSTGQAETVRPGRNNLSIRGQDQDIYFYSGSAGSKWSKPPVLFLPGDGGWRGAAVSIAETISSWGYDVYGFDTKRYLESFTPGNATLEPPQMGQDMESLGQWISARNPGRSVVIGWSQGAGMGVLAIASDGGKYLFQGLITLGMPESAVLGWKWKDTLAVLARREPDEPHFAIDPLLPAISPLPLWMIHATGDEYTRPEIARRLFASAKEPKRIQIIEGGNHRFDGRREEFFQSLKEGLAWVTGRSR